MLVQAALVAAEGVFAAGVQFRDAGIRKDTQRDRDRETCKERGVLKHSRSRAKHATQSVKPSASQLVNQSISQLSRHPARQTDNTLADQ